MRRAFVVASLATLLVSFTVRTQAGVVPQEWKLAIVSIEGATTPQEQLAGVGRFRALGTGFLISPDDKPPYRAFLFTAKHVFEGACALSTTVYLRHKNSPRDEHDEPKREELNICQRVPINRDGAIVITNAPVWTAHPSADLAGMVVPHTANSPAPAGVVVFSLAEVTSEEQEKQWYIGEGDETFTITFHPNLVRGQPSSPIVRHGIIAEYSEDAETFLIDSLAYPGNSGSPVVSKPTLLHRSETGYNFGQANPALLLGVVLEFVPYVDVAVSMQTSRPRITFEENSGLVRVLRSKRIVELLRIMAPLLGRR